MQQQVLTIINKLGLHARASAKLTQLAGKFSCDVWLTKLSTKQKVNAKSIMGVMMLAASQNTQLLLETNGTDETACLQEISQLIANKFGEGQ